MIAATSPAHKKSTQKNTTKTRQDFIINGVQLVIKGKLNFPFIMSGLSKIASAYYDVRFCGKLHFLELMNMMEIMG